MPRRMLPLAKSLVAMGHEVEILIPPWDCPSQADRVLTPDGVVLRFLAVGPTPHPLIDITLVRRLLAAAHAYQPDVVHAFKPFGYSGVAGQLLSRQGYSLFVDLDDREDVAGWGAQRPRLQRRLGGYQERIGLMTARGVTVASQDLCQYVENLRGTGEGILYLPNGLGRRPNPVLVEGNPPIVLVYSRGNDLDAGRLATIWAQLKERVPVSQLRLVGDWRPQPAIPDAEHLGWLSTDRLLTALATVAVAIFPLADAALVRAKSPARLLDCLGLGLPIVADRVAEYGRMLPPVCTVTLGDDQEFIGRVARLLSDRLYRAEIGRLTWEWAERHTWQARAYKLPDWYESLLPASP